MNRARTRAPAFLFVVFVRRGGDARRVAALLAARLHLRRATQTGLELKRRAQRRRHLHFLRMTFGRAARVRSANGLRRRAAAARVLRRSLARLRLAAQRVDLPGEVRGDGRVSGGYADEEARRTRLFRWWRVTRRSGHPASEARICEACARSRRVSSRTRVPERRVIAPERVVIVVQLERPHLAVGRAPTPFRRARGHTARATFCGLNEESAPCDSHCKSST